MEQYIRQVRLFFTFCFGALFLGLLYWQGIAAAALVARDDNPRTVIAEQRIQRGPIITKDGTRLAKTVFEDGLAKRVYPVPATAPVIGYYSLRYGTGGLEAAYDNRLRGEDQLTWFNRLMHQPAKGDAITVTLHLQAQQAAMTALAEADVAGAVVVLNVETGAILVLATWPTFDPNTLETNWEQLIADPTAPLLNRTTQGLFPLGEMARLIGLVAISEASQSWPSTSEQMPLPELFATIDKAKMVKALEQLHFSQPLVFVLPSAIPVIPDDLPEKAPELATTPLHIALIGAAISRTGDAPIPLLLTGQATAATNPLPLMKTATAIRLRPFISNLIGVALPEVTGSEPLSWYLGLVDARGVPLVAVAVITSSGEDRLAAKRLTQIVLAAIR